MQQARNRALRALLGAEQRLRARATTHCLRGSVVGVHETAQTRATAKRNRVTRREMRTRGHSKVRRTRASRARGSSAAQACNPTQNKAVHCVQCSTHSAHICARPPSSKGIASEPAAWAAAAEATAAVRGPRHSVGEPGHGSRGGPRGGDSAIPVRTGCCGCVVPATMSGSGDCT